MKKRFLSLLCVLALCLGLLPVTALAAENAPGTLYVGNQQLSTVETTCWTTNDQGKLAESAENENWNVKYEPSSATLTLKNATIKTTHNSAQGAVIYAESSQNSAVSLTIVLQGNNTIDGSLASYGIYLNAEANENIYGTHASLTIAGENDGSLEVSGYTYGINVKSGSGNASLTIENASVDAKTTSSYVAGVNVQSSMKATSSPQLSLAVNGGSLTANGGTSSDGILFSVGSPNATGAATSLTVSGNAIVDAKTGGISATRDMFQFDTTISSSTTDSNGGIVWDGTKGTVYGDVTLDESLTINKGETLTIPKDALLNCNSNLTNSGTILVESGGNLSGGTALTTPNITGQPTGQTVEEGKTAEFSVTASNAQTYQWQQSTDNGSSWADINGAASASYTTAATTTGMSGYQYRCVVTAGGVGVISDPATLTVTANTEPTSYIIATAEQLRNFANAVNGGNTTANAVLTADITLDSDSSEWTPIGKENACMYNGTFDGQGHTISGLQCSVTSGDFAGLFGVIGSNGVVKNLGTADSSVVATTGMYAYAGGVCGWNEGTIENCWNSGSVSASSSSSDTTSAAYAGGVCGWNQGTITNCWNSGSVTATANRAYAGGVCGINYKINDDNTAIQNCWNSGSVSANSSSSTAYAGGVCGDNTGSIDNCYWLDTACSSGVGMGRDTINPDVESKTADEFASGEVAWLLNQGQTGTPWGQGSNGMPVLEGNLPAGVTSYVPVRITIVMMDNTQKSYYSAKGSTFTEYPTGYAFVFKDGDTKTWINKGTQTYDADTTIYAENMTLEKIPAKAATCTENGHIEYWYCAAFNKYFKDENGVNEITYESTVIPATGHELTKVAAKEPTSTQAGNIEYWVCNNCGKYFSDEKGVNEITYESTVIPTTSHSSGGSSSSTKTSSQQAINRIEAAKDGSTVEINLSTGSTKLDKEVFEELSGKDVTLEISVPGGVTWTVNGQDIPADARLTDLDLGVSMNTSTIPVDLINAVTGEIGTVQITLKHDGEFGFTMTLTVPLDKEYAGYWANLYWYDEDADKLEFQSADKIAKDGTAEFALSHASGYAIVIDEESHEMREAEETNISFLDVKESDWFYDAVSYAVSHDLMSGMGDGIFSPNTPLQREMFSVILWNLEGNPAPEDVAPFLDVTSDKYYAEAIAWANEKGIVAGNGDTFGVGESITREQFAAILYRYAVFKDYDTTQGGMAVREFLDYEKISDYAKTAMTWAVNAGILGGNDDGTLNPQGSATRAEAATMLMNFCENMVK